MEEEWSTVRFELIAYKETGTYILTSPDEASQLLDEPAQMKLLSSWMTTLS